MAMTLYMYHLPIIALNDHLKLIIVYLYIRRHNVHLLIIIQRMHFPNNTLQPGPIYFQYQGNANSLGSVVNQYHNK